MRSIPWRPTPAGSHLPRPTATTTLSSFGSAGTIAPRTRRNYQRQADRFLGFIRQPLTEVRVGDLQAYITSLDKLASATRANMIAAVKSLLSFGQEIGYLRINVGKAVKAPPVKNTLAERIMGETDAMRMLALEPVPRNRALLTLLYGGGLRLSEVCGLRWRDLAPRDGAGQATVFGKGGKTRVVLLSANTWGIAGESAARPGLMIPCSCRARAATSTCRPSIAS